MKKKIFIIIFTAIIFIVCDAMSYWGIKYLEKKGKIRFFKTRDLILSPHQRELIEKMTNDETEYMTFSSSLGWKNKPNAQSGLYKTNSQGLRNNRDFNKEPKKGTLRIATFGDSFVHGDDVGNDEIWQELMMRDNPEVDVLNFGVPGYGVDQSFLRYQEEGQAFNPHITLLGVILDDYHRLVTINQYFISQRTSLILMKPRFFLKGGRLEFFPNPFQERSDYRIMLDDTDQFFHKYGKYDYFYSRILFEDRLSRNNTLKFSQIFYRKVNDAIFNPEIFVNRDYPKINKTVGGCINARSESFHLTNRIIESFHEQAVANGSRFYLVYFPNIVDFNTYKHLRIKRHQPLVDALDKMGITYLDLTEPLVAKNPDVNGKVLYSKTHHFSPEGHKQVLEIFKEFLGLDP